MHERSAQSVLLVEAFEEADPDGLVITHHDRVGAAHDAAAAGDDAEAIITARARSLESAVERRVPALRGIFRVSRLGFDATPWVVAIALVVGLATNVLGPRRLINLLSFPLFALLAWNISMYVVQGAAVALRAWRRRNGPPGRAPGERIANLFLRAALWRGWHVLRKAPGASVEDSQVITHGFARYGASWWQHASSLLTARVRRTLHLGAIAMIVGAVGGMYVRGFAFEYRATWESTLLESPHVQRLLEFVLGPAALILGRTIPDVAPLEGPDGHGAAALWLHLYGITALLVVVIPRVLLWIVETVRCRRLARTIHLDLDAPYYRRLSSARRGDHKRVEILPYSFHPRAPALDMLKTLFYDFFGARADIHVQGSLDYGATIDEVVALNGHPTGDNNDDDVQRCRVVLFNLAQSPEMEVHGTFVEELKRGLSSARDQLLVLLDVAGYRRRVNVPERWEERQRAWERVLRETGLTAVGVDTDQPVDDALIESVRGALWPDNDGGAH